MTRMFRGHRLPIAVILVAVLGIAGCGDSLPPVFQVTGHVVFKGGKGDVRRLKNTTVQFQSVTDPADMPGAAIEEDGRFTLHCVRGTKVVSGVKEGTYRCRILLSTHSDDPEHPRSSIVDPRYLSFKTTPLEYTITAGENDITVEIEGGGGR
jgi:hypothetical protein